MLAGLSSLGVSFGYGVETTAGEKPTAFTELNRINGLGGITVESETIDASSLRDHVTRTIAGRGDTGGTFTVTVNVTEDTQAEWAKVISDYKTAQAANKRLWFQTVVPGLSKAFFVVAQPPLMLPQPEISQNELLTMEIGLAIEEYKGMDTKVEMTGGEE